jgi:hypothetical protein
MSGVCGSHAMPDPAAPCPTEICPARSGPRQAEYGHAASMPMTRRAEPSPTCLVDPIMRDYATLRNPFLRSSVLCLAISLK